MKGSVQAQHSDWFRFCQSELERFANTSSYYIEEAKQQRRARQQRQNKFYNQGARDLRANQIDLQSKLGIENGRKQPF
jgi:hypothetical protein